MIGSCVYRTFLFAKIHRATVTAANVHYPGFVIARGRSPEAISGFKIGIASSGYRPPCND